VARSIKCNSGPFKQARSASKSRQVPVPQAGERYSFLHRFFVTKGATVNEQSEKQVERTPEVPAAQQEQMRLDESKMISSYANFARVTGTPEEVIVDFGLNPQPFGVPTDPVPVSQRIVMNFFTAKRLLAALHMTLQRHEAAFGVLETDVQKRVTPAAGGRR
jgi:hypothetical protein